MRGIGSARRLSTKDRAFRISFGIVMALGFAWGLTPLFPTATASPHADALQDLRHIEVVRAELQHDIELRAIQYFIDHANPSTGLVRDAAENFIDTPTSNNVASIASTGFALSVIVNAGTRGLIPEAQARAYALKTLRFVQSHVAQRGGWYLHFVDWQTGERMWKSEFSTIDTALFLGGALYAAQIYPGTEIASIAQSIYEKTDFNDMLTDGGTQPNKLTLSMAFTPEGGYTKSQWDMPAEQTLLLLLGLGHPTRPLPAAAWLAWKRTAQTLPDGRSLIGFNMPLFTHQYSQLFVDMRSFRDEFANYFENSVLATEVNRETCLHDQRYKTFREGFWGISAGVTPTGYAAPDLTNYSSTVCIGCALGSAMFDRDKVLNDVSTWLSGAYRAKIWGRYGLTDSLDLDQNWFSPRVLGITVGPLYMSLANADENTSIWKAFRQIPQIAAALHRAQSAK